MKIIAYSKTPSAVPFVHLGYLAASTTTIKPIQGLLVSGTILFVAGLSLTGKQLWQRRKSGELAGTKGLYAPRRVRIGFALLLPAVLAFGSAHVFGEKGIHYEHPKEATLEHIWVLEHRIAAIREQGHADDEVTALPTQEGEYEAAAVISIPAGSRRLYQERRVCFDAWSMPLALRVTQRDGELKYAVISAGPDRIMGTPDDITSAKARDG